MSTLIECDRGPDDAAATSPATSPAATAGSPPTRLIYAALAVVTVAAYLRAVVCDFIPFDDPTYIQENYRIHAGLTLDNIRWALTTDYFANWHPLTWLSYMLDCQLFGPHPAALHAVNVLLHVVNTLLLFAVLRNMTSATGSSAAAALLFALHPLHVESVAWISERKDMLSTMFWLLATAAYVGYARRPSLARYALVAALLFCGLMSKAMVVTLPCVLLLLDYWPLRRWPRGGEVAAGRRLRSAGRLIAEKVPLLAICAVSAVLTVAAQAGSRAVSSLEAISLTARVANAAWSYVAYLGKTFWPVNLAVFYPHSATAAEFAADGARFYLQAAAAGGLLLAVTAAVVVVAQRRPYLAVGWFWYLGTLVPVIGLVQVGGQAMADRYTYVPLIGIFIMVAWGVPDVLRRVPARNLWLAAAGTTAVAACAALTWVQVGYWRNGVTLFTHAVEAVEKNGRGHGMLGTALALEGRHAEAIPHFEKAVEFEPNYVAAYKHLASSLHAVGKPDEAETRFLQAVALDPNHASTRFNYGNLLLAVGRLDEAIVQFQAALRLEPSMAKAHNNLAVALERRGNFAEAAHHYAETLRINPSHAHARQNLELLRARANASAQEPEIN